MVIANGKTRGRSLLWWFEQVIYTIAVNLEILKRNLNLCSARSVLFNLFTPPVYGAQQSGDHTTVGQRLSSPHRMCFAGTGTAVREDGQVEAVEQVFYGR